MLSLEATGNPRSGMNQRLAGNYTNHEIADVGKNEWRGAKVCKVCCRLTTPSRTVQSSAASLVAVFKAMSL